MCMKYKLKEYVKNEVFIGLKHGNCYSVGQINLWSVWVSMVFPTVQIGGVTSTSQRFVYPTLPHLKQFPPVDFTPSKVNTPTKKQFSHCNPVKTLFLAVFIVLVPLF